MKESCSLNPEQLNSYQKEAVLDESRACLVNACVGSGKTTVLTLKTEYLHHRRQIPYEDMMVLTFTNKAAGEILSRLQVEEAGQYHFGTFHSVAMQLLQESPELEQSGWKTGFTVIESEEELELAEQLIVAHKLKVKYRNRLAKRLSQEKHLWREGQPSRYKDDLFALYPLLKEAKQSRNRMSFDDLMEQVILLLRRQKSEGTIVYPSWLIVDEVQDCNAMQVEFLQLLYGPQTHLFAVGDPNQMIYSFRGGDQTLFYRIKEQFQAKELSLPINYRSNASILAVANRFRQYGNRIVGADAPEISPAAGSEGQKIPVHNYYDAFLEAEILTERIRQLQEEGTPFGEIAVLYRMQEQSAQLERTFEREGIPYEVYRRGETLEGNDVVHLLTLHACKGLEFDVVFIIGANQGLIPLTVKDEAQREEEQRLFFVGMTRARKMLEFSWYTNPNNPRVSGQMSPFLRMIPERFLKIEGERSEQEKTRNLQMLRKEVQKELHAKETEVTAKEMVHHASHPHYGTGVVVSEDDMMITVEFPEYGPKEFMKMFGEVRILD